MTKTLLTSFALAALGSMAIAGTASVAGSGKGKQVQPQPEPAPAELGLVLSAGYDTTYFWHGTRVGDELAVQKLEYNTALNDKASLTLGQWYGRLSEYKYNELDLYGSLNYNLGAATVSVGFTYYRYFDGAALDAQYEPFVKIATSALPVDLYAAYYYETEVAGSYVEIGAAKKFEISQSVDAIVSVVGAYNDGLTTPESGFNHVYVGLALPIELTNTITLTPYIGGNFAQEATEGLYKDDNILVGGASVSVRF